MVKSVTEEVMAGDSPVIKRLNALLTKKFVGAFYLPHDECLEEAKHLATLPKRKLRSTVRSYLERRFGSYRGHVEVEVAAILSSAA